MNLFQVFILSLYLFAHVKAQSSSQSNQQVLNPIHPSLAAVLIVLSIMFAITFLIVAYAKYCHSVTSHRLSDVQDPSGNFGSRSRFSGIDRTIIESLPFFQFSSLKGSKEGLECAVCLSRFDEDEILRLLPKCSHAFHISCIDKWLESHSSCPLCRHRFDMGDLTNFTYTNSLRYARIPSNLTEDSNVEIFVQREQEDNNKSSRFNMAESIQKLAKGKIDELLDKKLRNNSNEQLLHKFKHKIIFSDVINKSRWSDVNSSDLMSLNSEMLNFVSSKRFLTGDSLIGRYDQSITTGLFDPAEKRSMSEITNVSRFAEFRGKGHGLLSTGNNDNDNKVRRLWLPIARRTIQWFGGQEIGHGIRRQP